MPLLKAEMEGLPANSVVADLGCGNGAVLAQFLDSGFDLHGLEVSESRVAQGQKAHPGIQYSYADLTSDLSSHLLAGKSDVVIRTEVVEDVFLPRIFATKCS